jgi:hypothetical protein
VGVRVVVGEGALGVEDGGVVVEEVPAVDVVGEAAAVVVEAVRGRLAGVRPDVGLEVWVADVHALVDDADDDLPAPRRRVPGGLGVDVGARGALRLPRVFERPLRGERRVVRRGELAPDVVGLGVDDVGARAQRLDGGQRLAGAHAREAQAADDL